MEDILIAVLQNVHFDIVYIMNNMTCFFEECQKPIGADGWRCHFHRNRERCCVSDCRRQAYAKKLCARHGGKSKCAIEDCPFRVRSMGLCSRHGVKRNARLCQEVGCGKPAQSHGLCIRHGGGRRCKFDGCGKFARTRGLCCRHSRDETFSLFDNIPVMEKDVLEIASLAELLDTTEVLKLNELDEVAWDFGILDLLINMK
ncbi:hypothetical protein AC1031_007960 [Aphanomyces cochlioides]|nr:hypothetical protein AC1031_007960 [Aphanomyces cochlioides]